MAISDQKITLTLPELALIGITRGAFGAGVGLLVANVLERNARRSAGVALIAVGVLTTVPILLRVRHELR